jgi:hypothetical protein
MSEPEIWNPHPSEWWDAEIHYTEYVRRFIVFKLGDYEASALERNIRPSGLHHLCRPKGEPVSLRVERTPTGKFEVLEARFPDSPESQTGQIEEIKVHRWNGTFGAGHRLCRGGCSIFLISQNKNDVRDLKPGDIVTAKIERSDRAEKGIIARLVPQEKLRKQFWKDFIQT